MMRITARHHLLLLILMIMVFALALGGSWFEVRYADRFYPGVFIGNEAVGGKTYAEVLEHFSTKARMLEQDGLHVVFEDATSTHETIVPKSASGLTADNVVEYFSLGNWEEPIKQAQAWGHSGPLRQRVAEKFSLLSKTKQFNFLPTLHENALISLFSHEVDNFLPRTEPAHFLPRQDALAIAHEKIGKSIDTKAALDMVRSKLASLDTTPSYISAQEDPTIATEAHLKPFLAFAHELARTTRLMFYNENHRWAVDGETLASWLTLQNESEIGVDPAKLKDFLSATVAPVITTSPQNQNSRFEIRNHKLVETFSGKPSRIIDAQKTIQIVQDNIATIRKSFTKTNNLWPGLAAISSNFDFITQSGTIDIPIQTEDSPPSLRQSTIESYGMSDLVGEAKTSFPGSSAARIHNIAVGAAKLSGMLIAPGQEFSTINSLGALTEEAGFVKEFVIKDNRTIKELGGGLCQIATTLFRLALNAGLPITERVNHSYIVSYYGIPGLDATTYSPKPDFRFVNDTGKYLLLHGAEVNNELTLEIYGQKDGRTADVSAPVLSDERAAPPPQYLLTPDLPPGKMECSETPRKGLTADVTYTVTYPTGETKQQNFHSVYEPWRKTCLVGVGYIEPKQ